MFHMSNIWSGVHTDREILGTFHSADDFISYSLYRVHPLVIPYLSIWAFKKDQTDLSALCNPNSCHCWCLQTCGYHLFSTHSAKIIYYNNQPACPKFTLLIKLFLKVLSSLSCCQLPDCCKQSLLSCESQSFCGLQYVHWYASSNYRCQMVTFHCFCQILCMQRKTHYLPVGIT